MVADAAADLRVSALPPVVAGQVGAYLGVPLTSESGTTVGALCVFDPSPRSWSAAEVSLLTQLAHSAAAEPDRGADRRARDQPGGLGAGDRGSGRRDVRLEPADRSAHWDSRLIRLFGLEGESFVATTTSTRCCTPMTASGSRSPSRLRSRRAAGTTQEYRIVRPDGSTRWLAARGRALAGGTGSAVRVLGAAYDTTARRESDAQVARVLETMNAAFFHVDRAWCFTYVNGHAEKLLERSRAQLLGQSLWELFQHALGSDFETHYRAAMGTGRPSSSRRTTRPRWTAGSRCRRGPTRTVWPSTSSTSRSGGRPMRRPSRPRRGPSCSPR